MELGSGRTKDSMVKRRYCIDCGKPIKYGVPVQFDSATGYVCRQCFYASMPQLAPRGYNPLERWQSDKAFGFKIGDRVQTVPLGVSGAYRMRGTITGFRLVGRKGVPSKSLSEAVLDNKRLAPISLLEHISYNPIRHTSEGWFWGTKGPFSTKSKAVSVMRAVYASGYKGKNPTSLYQAFHGANPGKIRKVKIEVPKRLIKIGRLISLDYEPENPSKRKGIRYTHKFGDTGERMLPEKPLLAASKDGKQLFIVNDGSSTHFSERGIIA